MQIVLINVKQTLSKNNIDINDNVAVSQKVVSIFPDYEGWNYDENNDVMYIYRPNPLIADTSTLGEVENIDYTVE